jgi:hypothetical protein
MRHVLSSCAFALAAAVAVSAQDTTIKSETRIQADDAKVTTISGCLTGGPSKFTLTNVATAQVPVKPGDNDDKPVGTAGAVVSYDLVGREGFSFAPHVGQKVELVGVVVKAANGGDDDAKVEVRERTEVDREDAPDSKSETTTKARIARGPSPQFSVTSLKMVSPVCLQ